MGRKGSYDTVSNEPKSAGCAATVSEGFASFRKMLWDPETKTVFGRGGKSWGKFIFYFISWNNTFSGKNVFLLQIIWINSWKNETYNLLA